MDISMLQMLLGGMPEEQALPAPGQWPLEIFEREQKVRDQELKAMTDQHFQELSQMYNPNSPDPMRLQNRSPLAKAASSIFSMATEPSGQSSPVKTQRQPWETTPEQEARWAAMDPSKRGTFGMGANPITDAIAESSYTQAKPVASPAAIPQPSTSLSDIVGKIGDTALDASAFARKFGAAFDPIASLRPEYYQDNPTKPAEPRTIVEQQPLIGVRSDVVGEQAQAQNPNTFTTPYKGVGAPVSDDLLGARQQADSESNRLRQLLMQNSSTGMKPSENPAVQSQNENFLSAVQKAQNIEDAKKQRIADMLAVLGPRPQPGDFQQGVQWRGDVGNPIIDMKAYASALGDHTRGAAQLGATDDGQSQLRSLVQLGALGQGIGGQAGKDLQTGLARTAANRLGISTPALEATSDPQSQAFEQMLMGGPKDPSDLLDAISAKSTTLTPEQLQLLLDRLKQIAPLNYRQDAGQERSRLNPKRWFGDTIPPERAALLRQLEQMQGW